LTMKDQVEAFSNVPFFFEMQSKEYSQGYYAYRPPGMVHGEMEILDDDTVLLIMLSGPLDYHEVEAK